MPLSAPAAFFLTLKPKQVAFERFDMLRRTHFPPKRNFTPADLTLFHAWPSEQANSTRSLPQAGSRSWRLEKACCSGIIWVGHGRL
jgi:hypothetical protein